MFWFNFILGLNCIFFSFKIIIIHYQAQNERKYITTKDKIEPQHTQNKVNFEIKKTIWASSGSRQDSQNPTF